MENMLYSPVRSFFTMGYDNKDSTTVQEQEQDLFDEIFSTESQVYSEETTDEG
jgi:hypothetical protein